MERGRERVREREREWQPMSPTHNRSHLGLNSAKLPGARAQLRLTAMVNEIEIEWRVRRGRRVQAILNIIVKCIKGPLPMPPDALDRRLSKRGWEHVFWEWRVELRRQGLLQ